MKKLSLSLMLTLFSAASAQVMQDAGLELTADQHAEVSKAAAAQAQLAYPQPFYDRTLWKTSVDHAFAAYSEEESLENKLALADLYTVTQWWINGYRHWKSLPQVPAEYREQAKLTALKLATLARMRGDMNAYAQYMSDVRLWSDPS